MHASKKRPLQQDTLRKKKHIETPKKRRTSYLQNHLLVFEINDKYRVDSKRTPFDCFVCTLQYLNILDKDYADMLRAFVVERGATIDQMLHILKVALKDKYTKIVPDMLPFDSIYQLFDLLTPSSATIVGLMADNGAGHIVLLAKDIHGEVGIIDPQTEQTCVKAACEKYVRPYKTNPLYIFTHV